MPILIATRNVSSADVAEWRVPHFQPLKATTDYTEACLAATPFASVPPAIPNRCNGYRPLIRIKRKGRPFATCSICQATPCEAPSEHARLKREAELKSPSSKKATHGRLYPRHSNPNGFLPIAPRPTGSGKDVRGSSSTRASRSGSTSAASVSSSHTPVRGSRGSRRNPVRGSVGEWSGSEASGNESGGVNPTGSASGGANVSSQATQTLSRSAPDSLAQEPVGCGVTFDPMYSLLPSSSASVSGAQMVPMIGPLEDANPFDFPLDPALTLDDTTLGYLEDMEVDITEGLTEDLFHVEDWSRYMWSPETGFEHLDTGYPPVSQ
ncbi:hypothetical protein N7462_006646 [Penicillium macrosclerotiorum]|uniref:uncharacterized protein n=1 Tax=Penicillium macrosclerotiorum TaxID=303699 RepID=UPI002546D034|nr:uncharacterized protein N7462_006646 [Penicillium macrosclerotiorum]KAJ5683481.1 hypothetical protein N7462_006646 [Penicillium macrosclerotiorum]